MSQADRVLLLSEDRVEPRRGFLKRLFAAPVAALATHQLILPAKAAEIIRPDEAAARLQHHVDGVKAAMQDLFPGAVVGAFGNCLDGHHAYYRKLHARGENEYARIGCRAGLH